MNFHRKTIHRPVVRTYLFVRYDGSTFSEDTITHVPTERAGNRTWKGEPRLMAPSFPKARRSCRGRCESGRKGRNG